MEVSDSGDMPFMVINNVFQDHGTGVEVSFFMLSGSGCLDKGIVGSCQDGMILRQRNRAAPDQNCK